MRIKLATGGRGMVGWCAASLAAGALLPLGGCQTDCEVSDVVETRAEEITVVVDGVPGGENGIDATATVRASMWDALDEAPTIQILVSAGVTVGPGLGLLARLDVRELAPLTVTIDDAAPGGDDAGYLTWVVDGERVPTAGFVTFTLDEVTGACAQGVCAPRVRGTVALQATLDGSVYELSGTFVDEHQLEEACASCTLFDGCDG